MALHAMRLSVKPISADQRVEYEAGRRIGYHEGTLAAKQQIVTFLSGQSAKDDDL